MYAVRPRTLRHVRGALSRICPHIIGGVGVVLIAFTCWKRNILPKIFGQIEGGISTSTQAPLAPFSFNSSSWISGSWIYCHLCIGGLSLLPLEDPMSLKHEIFLSFSWFTWYPIWWSLSSRSLTCVKCIPSEYFRLQSKSPAEVSLNKWYALKLNK